MKILQILLFFIYTSNYSQTNENLYITYNDAILKNIVSESDKNLIVEIFRVTIKDHNPVGYILGYDKSGKIGINTALNGRGFPLFEFTYVNENGNNPEKEIFRKDIRDVLDYNEILKLTYAENFEKTLHSFKNIYFVHLQSDDQRLLAKKVDFKSVPRL